MYIAVMSVKNDLRRLRFEADEITQQQLADAAGVSRQTIVAIERGNYNPSVELALRLAAILGTTVERIFQLGEPPAKGRTK